MKRLLIIISLLSFTISTVWGVESESCISEGSNYSEGVNISAQCIQWVRDNATLATQIEIKNSLKVYGHQNILLLAKRSRKKHEELFPISGQKSSLHKIISIDISYNHRWIAILNEDEIGDRSVLHFPVGVKGNLTPSKVISDKNFRYANSIAYHPNDKQLFVAFPERGEVILYGNKHDSRLGKKRSESLLVYDDKISGEEQVVLPTSISTSKSHLYVFDSKLKQITAFSIRNNRISLAPDNNVVDGPWNQREIKAIRHLHHESVILSE